MITTSDLIDVLSDGLEPVRRLRPLARAATWLMIAALVLVLLMVSQGVRPNLAARVHDSAFVIGFAASLLTGVLAGAAAFMVSVPDRSRLWLLLPLPTLILWVSTIGYNCLTDWVSIGPSGIHMGEAIRCFATLLMVSMPLSIAMLAMLRYAALLRPTDVCLAGGLAVAAITSFALSLLHELDATVMILVWNLGVAAMIAGLARLFGCLALTWTAARLTPTALRVSCASSRKHTHIP